MTRRYILIEGKPIPEPDLMKWAEWFEVNENRIVKQTRKGEVFVSTVFLGIDHDFSFKGPPVLYETMVFGGKNPGDMDRYETREEALQGHEAFVQKYLPHD